MLKTVERVANINYWWIRMVKNVRRAVNINYCWILHV